MNVRSDFPILKTHPELVYLDSISTSLVPEVAIEATEEFMTHTLVSSRRGTYRLAANGSRIVDKVRSSLAEILNTNDSQLSFQKSLASAAASIAYGYDWSSLNKSKVVVAQSEEHNIFVPLLRACQILDLEFELLPIDNHGSLDPDKAAQVIDRETGIVAVSHVTTGLGQINPLDQISQVTQENNALLLTDASRSVGFTEFKIASIPADIVLFSANIGFLGPPGLALQWQTSAVSENHIPGIIGGSAVTSVGSGSFDISKAPHRFESDILNLPAIAGLGASIEYLNKIGTTKIVSKNRRLSKTLFQELERNEDVCLYGLAHDQRTVFGFNIGAGNELNCHDAALFLDQADIAVRSGYLCAYPSIRKIAPDGLIQISFHFYNTPEEIHRVGEMLLSIAELV